MKCPECHSDNPDTTRYCGECGTQLRSPEEISVAPTKTLQTPQKGFTKGKTIAGKYEVMEELGRGGMGVVYKAQDTKLKRTVALKFLSPELTRDEEAKERFIHEAQAASALDHPNICTVHEIDESEGQMFIAMAHVEGQSLREKIRLGPLKLDETLDIAIQSAEGLHEAHEKKIVHRDIKSSNIMVTSKGQAKIMDFGVAKLAGRTKFTRTGTTMGTIAYMSPEQAQGERVDYRTDIWSLGVVIYEMVTGQLPFKGDHEQAVVYSILNEEPEPITGLRTGVPIELERIVNKTLAKSPGERYQHADELAVDLRTLRNNLTDFIKAPTTVSRRPSISPVAFWKQPIMWKILAGLISVVAIIVLWSVLRPRQPLQRPISRFTINLPPGEALAGPGCAVALSRDGKKVVYTAKREDTTQIYLRAIDEFETKPIRGTEGATSPFFSPDGNWVGFFADDKLKKISLLGGEPYEICEADAYGGSWSPDDNIVFVETTKPGLHRVPAMGGKPEQLTKGQKILGEIYEGEHKFPQIFPDGKAILYTQVVVEGRHYRIAVHSFERDEQKILFEDGSHARYVPTGHIVYARAGDLLAVPFDIKKLEVTGTPILLLEGVQMSWDGTAHFSVSENGVLVYVPGSAVIPPGTLVWVNHKGEAEPFRDSKISSYQPRISPDGRQLAFQYARKMSSIWLFELERGTLRRFTDDKYAEWWPLWTLDGKHVIFNSNQYGGQAVNLYIQAADGSSRAERLTKSAYHHQAQCWSPDGKELLFTEGMHPETGMDIWVLPFEGDRNPRPLIRTRFNEFHPVLSPDGRWLAYASDETGQWEVYLRSYPNLGRTTRISTNGGGEPLWSRDGGKLFFRNLNGDRMMEVSIITEPSLRVGKPRLLFEGDYFVCSEYGRSYDITPDGKRFLLIADGKQQTVPTKYNVVINWFEELKRLVPSK